MKPKPGQYITLKQAIDMFRRDMAGYERRVNKSVGSVINTQHVYNGFVSFDFNTGAIISGTVDDKLRAGNLDGALRVLNMYTKAGGRVMRGLVTRRKEETDLIKYGRYPDRKVLVRDRPGAKPRYLRKAEIPWGNYPIGELTVPGPRITGKTRKDPDNFILDLLKFIWKALSNEKKTC